MRPKSPSSTFLRWLNQGLGNTALQAIVCGLSAERALALGNRAIALRLLGRHAEAVHDAGLAAGTGA